MFKDYSEIYLKKETNFKSGRKIYSIFSNRKVIGTIEEVPHSSKNIGNQLLKLLNLHSAISLEMDILDAKENVVGKVKKEKGFHKDFHLFSETNETLAEIKPNIKVKSSTLLVTDTNGDEIIKADGGYGAIDFSVIDCHTQKRISSIKRRSLVYETIKENLLNDDGYYIDNHQQDSIVTFALFTMGVVLDMYYFNS